MTNTYGWQKFYEAAMLETQNSRLPLLIQAATAAIDARLQQLRDDHDCAEERQAIADALSALKVIQREVANT